MQELTDSWKRLNAAYTELDEIKKSTDNNLGEMQIAKHLALVAELEHRFIEEVTFAEFNEAKSLMEYIYQYNFLEFPVWARNIVFRLACLMQPTNAEIRNQAAIDLRYFGPDWDTIADHLEQEAAELHSAS